MPRRSVMGGPHVERLAEGVEHVADGHVADGTVIASPVSTTAGAADEPSGGLHGDGAHHVVADVLGDLEGQRARAVLALDVPSKLTSTLRAL